MRLAGWLVTGIVLWCSCVFLVPGCAGVRAGCPYCNRPAGVLPAGTEVTCPGCRGVYRVYPPSKPDHSPPAAPAVPPQYHHSDEHPRRR
jgi:hypothetical protein